MLRMFLRETRPSSKNATEQESPTVPQGEFSTIIYTPLNMAITLMNDGLSEIELVPRPMNGVTELKLTLLRSVGWLSRDDLITRKGYAGPFIETPGAQCLGKHKFRFSLQFTNARVKWKQVLAITKNLLSPPIHVPLVGSSFSHKSTQSFAKFLHLLKILSSTDLVICAAEPYNDGRYLLRVLNHSDSPLNVNLMRMKDRFSIIELYDLLESALELEDEHDLPKILSFKPWELKQLLISQK